nr:EOG090X051L [Ceriodaphnia reticulata]
MSSPSLVELASLFKIYVDFRLKDQSPLKLIVLSAGAAYSFAWLQKFLTDEELSMTERAKRYVFSWVRIIPLVKKKVEDETMKARVMMEEDMNKCTKSLSIYSQLPKNGRSVDEVAKEAKEYLELGDCDWKAGGLSGCVYNVDPEVTNLVTQVYGMSAWTNPLHPEVFPGIRKMEAEIVQMAIHMFHGGRDACGTMTSGGSESLLLACKAYRDYARNVKGIKHPEILMPASGHAAFDKASQLYRMRLVRVPVDPKTHKADVKAMEKAINKNTCMLLASAPGFPHGVLDPVLEIAALGRKYNIPVHVDACLGGFVIAFMDDAGYPLPPFDFRVEGVTSISADTHKYGYAPKGSSVILYSHPKYRQQQFFVATEWPGGIYASPTLAGSRPGGLIAACWASMMYYGRSGYVEATKKIAETHRFIEKGHQKLKGLDIFLIPTVSFRNIDSRSFVPQRMIGNNQFLGSSNNGLRFAGGILQSIIHYHTPSIIKDTFCYDIPSCQSVIKTRPCRDVKGRYQSSRLAISLLQRTVTAHLAMKFLDAFMSIFRTMGP